MKYIVILLIIFIYSVNAEEAQKAAKYNGQTSGPLFFPALLKYRRENNREKDYFEYKEYKEESDTLSNRANAETDGTKQAIVQKELEALNEKNRERFNKLYKEGRVFLHAVVVNAAKSRDLYIIESYDGFVRGLPKESYSKYVAMEMVDITNDVLLTLANGK